MYRTLVTLFNDGKIIDQVEQRLGLRFFTVDHDQGFFLNGEHLQLRGICLHQDRNEKGNAISHADEDEDVNIILEMGANAVRISHYPHSQYFYDLLDKNGIVAWSEIPLVGAGDYVTTGYINSGNFRENGKAQLKEMIRQNFNNPAICFWGLFNELKLKGDNPEEYIKELNQLAKTEDPSRLTTAATYSDDVLTKITDLMGWNKYYGWYGKNDNVEMLGKWADKMHNLNPNFRIAVSEYGAGASINQHEEELIKPSPSGKWHPEAWQATFHEESWKILNERSFIWGTFIWNMFDFGAALRKEGDRNGCNDKGLVTFDHKTRKDAFWFYKANWNTTEPVLYIANRRYVHRTSTITSVKVYSNQQEVQLFVNGKSLGKRHGDYAIFKWDNVVLQKGENTIEVKSNNKKTILSDKCIWIL